MKLWLLRHGEAEPHASRDSERRLTAHGRKEVLQSAARLAGLPLDGILASPYVRAQQTAGWCARHWAWSSRSAPRPG